MALNVDATPAIRTFTVVPPPITTITSGPGTLNAEGERVSREDSAVFAFPSNQPGSTFECSLDEGGLNPGEFNGFFPCTSPVAYFRLADGEHTFEVRATNPEGVIEEPPALYEWFVELGPDTVAPDTRILSGPASSDPLSVATFTFTGEDNRAAELTFECALDGTGVQLLHLAGGVLRHGARHARAACPRPRRRRQPRPDAGAVRVGRASRRRSRRSSAGRVR